MVHRGETAVLPCHCPHPDSVVMMKVVKLGLKSGYCIFYREGRLQESFQHPSFKGRVDFKDPHRENGDFSTSLRNVSVNDTGTYESVCGYKAAGGSDSEQFTYSNELMVKDGLVQDRGHAGLILLSVLLFFFFFHCSS